LQRAFNKYEEDALTFAKIALVPSDDLIRREQEQIDSRDRKMLYNSSPTAGSCAGVKHSDEVRARMSAAQQARAKEYTPSAETRAKLSEAGKGRRHTDEARAKMSAALTGREFSDETRAKLSAARLGQKPNQETRVKLSAAKKGKKISEAARKARSGRKISEEHRKKISASNAARLVSAETREKIRNALLGREISEDTKAKRKATRLRSKLAKVYAEKLNPQEPK